MCEDHGHLWAALSGAKLYELQFEYVVETPNTKWYLNHIMMQYLAIQVIACINGSLQILTI